MSAMRPTDEGACAIALCARAGEVDRLGRLITTVNNGSLISYRRWEDFICNPPRSAIGMFVVGADEAPADLLQALHWLRERYPRHLIVVVGDEGGGEQEMTARRGGASYVTRPVPAETWWQLLSHAFAGRVRASQAELADS